MRGFKEVNSLRGVVVTFFPATSYQRSKLKSGQKEARPHRPLRLSRGSRIGTQRPPPSLSPFRLRYSWCKNISDVILCIPIWYIILVGLKAHSPQKLDWGIPDLDASCPVPTLICHISMTKTVEKFSHSDRMELAVKIPLRLDGQKSKQYPYAAAAARRKDPRQFSGSQAAWNVQEPSVLVHFTDSTLQRLKILFLAQAIYFPKWLLVSPTPRGLENLNNLVQLRLG